MSKRVLVVDDQAYLRELVRDTLRTRGYATRLASSGEEALELLAREKFVLVITDVVMPGMEGFELLTRIKKLDSRVKVVILTGYSRHHDISEFILHGADEYLSKPFQVRELLDTVERVLAGES